MEKNVEKSCLEEISHSVCDENRKVIITEITNNWSISYKESEAVLKKWLSNYSGGKNILKEYLIRGVDLNGNCVITVVPERKLEALEQICPKYTSSLYSIELEGVSGRSLNIAEPAKNKFISLPLESTERKCKVASIPVSPAKPIKTEPSSSKPSTSKGFNSLFGAATIKTETSNGGASVKVEVKDEKSSSQKVISPRKISPRNDSPKKKAAKPPAAKSISSFFSAKPTISKPAAETKSVKIEPDSEKAPSKETEKHKEPLSDGDAIPGSPQSAKSSSSSFPSKPTASKKSSNAEKTAKVVESMPVKKESKKRVLPQSDDEAIPGTPPTKAAPANKKQKKEPAKMINDKAAKQRSRIMQICDSSSDEEEASTSKPANEIMETDNGETTVKKEKENTTPTKNSAPDAMETDANGGEMNGSQKPNKRGKVKKMITKTFEDEEGFINSIRVMEEVSCSEDEEAPVEKKPATKANGISKESAEKEKKKISPPAGKKQGSILSFFSKK